MTGPKKQGQPGQLVRTWRAFDGRVFRPHLLTLTQSV